MIENQKIRLEYIWKVCAICLHIIGFLILYFAQNIVTVANLVELIFLATLSICSHVVINSVKYLHNELYCMQIKIDNHQKIKAEKYYKNIFIAFKVGVCTIGLYLAILICAECLAPSAYNFLLPDFSKLVFLLVPHIGFNLLLINLKCSKTTEKWAAIDFIQNINTVILILLFFNFYHHVLVELLL